MDVNANGDVAAEIPGFGVWRYEDATGWMQLTPADASLAAIDASGDVAVDFPVSACGASRTAPAGRS